MRNVILEPGELVDAESENYWHSRDNRELIGGLVISFIEKEQENQIYLQ